MFSLLLISSCDQFRSQILKLFHYFKGFINCRAAVSLHSDLDTLPHNYLLFSAFTSKPVSLVATA